MTILAKIALVVLVAGVGMFVIESTVIGMRIVLDRLSGYLLDVWDALCARVRFERDFAARVRRMRRQVRGEDRLTGEELCACAVDDSCERCGDSVHRDEVYCSECVGEMRREVRLEEDRVGGVYTICDWCGEKKDECDCMWEGRSV
jgi:hypothetical protein